MVSGDGKIGMVLLEDLDKQCWEVSPEAHTMHRSGFRECSAIGLLTNTTKRT